MTVPPALLQALEERFEWIDVLGEGAHGWVGLVRERALDRRVALKLGKHRGDPERLARFEREARIAAGLRHTHVVTVHSTGVVAGHPYLVLDYVEGAHTLREAQRGVPVEQQLEALLDVTRGVAHAHERGVVHRDLKPENVLVGPNAVAQVTDFGCATMQGVERLTRSGALVGTPHYMAPEQIMGQRGKVGPHTDVWALGVMLYEVACGHRPFEGDSLLELASKVSSGEVDPDLLPGVPPGLRAVIVRCLTPAPGGRVPDAGALAEALEAVLGGQAWGTTRGARLTLVLALAAALVGLGGVAWAATRARSHSVADTTSVVDGESGAEALPADVAAWGEVQSQPVAADFLLQGEAWLLEFPQSALREEVELALVERRHAEPRWVVDSKDSRFFPPLTTRDALVLSSFARGGRILHTLAWDDGATQECGVGQLGVFGVYATAADEGVWLLGMRSRTERVVTYVPGLPEPEKELRAPSATLRVMPNPVLLSRDGRRLVLLHPQGWLSIVRKEDGELVAAESGATRPFAGGKLKLGALSADGTTLLCVGREDQGITDGILAIRVSDGEVCADKRVPYSLKAILPLASGETLASNSAGQLVLYDVDFNDPQVLVDPSAGATRYKGGKAIAGVLFGLAEGPNGRLYAVGELGTGVGDAEQDAHVGTGEGRLQVWSREQRTLIDSQEVPLYYWVVLSPDGRYLACCGLGRVDVWDRWLPGEWQPRH